jgi:hypothetical protein
MVRYIICATNQSIAKQSRMTYVNTTLENAEKSSDQNAKDVCQKLKYAYIDERVRLEIVEVELNRTKIVMVDEKGRMRKISLIPEH